MAFERRGSQAYYYTSERVGPKVRKTYIGRGPLAVLAAERAEIRKKDREQRRQQLREEKAAADLLASYGNQLTDRSGTLMSAGLLLAGYKYRRGEWSASDGNCRN